MATEPLQAVRPIVLPGPTHDLMSINPIAYEDFQTTKTAFANEGGAWVGINTPAAGSRVYISESGSWCGGNCLESQLRNTVDDRTVPEFGTYVANVSVNMAQYGNANSLDFTWGFSPLYAETPTAQATRPIHSEVNDASFDDTMTGVDPTTFNQDHSWTGGAIFHSGTASVSRTSDNRGYIKLLIRYSPLPNSATFPSIAQWTKDISFKITTPMSSVLPGGSTSTGSSTSGSSNSLTQSLSGSGSQTLPYLSFPGGSSGSPSGLPGTPNPNDPSQSSTAPVSSAAIAGIAIGGVAVLMIVVAFILFRRRKRNAATMAEEYDTMAEYETATEAYAYPVERKQRIGSMGVPPTYTPNESIPLVPSSRETPSSSLGIGRRAPSMSNYGPPPNYGNAQSVVDMSYDDIPAAPPALAEFARANRDVIGDDLEARLAAAGYLPTDDPDNLSEQEWITKYNVTVQELDSLRELYHSPRR